MLPNAAIDRFHSTLMDSDLFNEAMMAAAVEVVQYYAGGEPLTEKDYEMAQELCTRVSVS